MNQRYTREEHLKKKNQIDFLFEKGTWVSKYPLKMVYLFDPDLKNHRVGVSVSKRNFKRAVDRNYVKRLLRNCYRLHKNELDRTHSSPLLFMLVYTGKEIISFKEVEEKYLLLLTKLQSQQKNI